MIEPDAPSETTAASRRVRLLFAAAAGFALLGVVAGVVLSGGEEEFEAVAVDPACIEDWNDDPVALEYGRHNFTFHKYEEALVTHLNAAAEEVAADAEDAVCAVIFPSRVLDPEPFAAGQVFSAGAWMAISDLPAVELTRVAELQVEAADAPNAVLNRQGGLTGL